MADKVLIVDDDPSICRLLEKVMHSNELETTVADSGLAALNLLKNHSYDMILMDITLGDMEGFDVIKKLRSQGIQTPVMIISGRNEDYDALYGLSLGADDYITKHFDLGEVESRVLSNLMRQSSSKVKEQTLQYRDLVLSKDAKSVLLGGQDLELTAKEYAILQLLMEHPKKVYTKANLYETVWEDEYLGDDNAVKTHISNLRNKLKKASPLEQYIETVWGIGYRMYKE